MEVLTPLGKERYMNLNDLEAGTALCMNLIDLVVGEAEVAALLQETLALLHEWRLA